MMKSDIVIDTSAIIAVVTGERMRKAVIKATTGAKLFAPQSVWLEIGRVLVRRLRERIIEPSRIEPALRSVQQMEIGFVEVNMQTAILLAHEISSPAFDAYVIQCARELRLPLLTLDQPMKALAAQLNIPLIHP